MTITKSRIMQVHINKMQREIDQLQQQVYSMTDFVCVYFGKGWCITARGFADIYEAHNHGVFMMPTPGVQGFAVIVHGKEFWQVREDQSIMPDSMKIEMGEWNNFDVVERDQ